MFFGILLLQLILSVECVDIEEEIIHRVSKASNRINFKSCFEHLGCIDTNEVWYHDHIRPVNLEPLDRHTIRTEFIMIKNQSACRDKRDLVYDTVQVKADSIQNAGFKPESNTMLLIHDFTSNGYTGWIKHFAKVMEPSGTNIISVDWEGGAEPPFDQAIANARVVALEIINFYGVLNESFHVEPSKVHIVGHGIGAHIAGYVGRAIKGISRITALDPTGPRFEGMPEEVSLHKSHANYVEVLHTDSYNPRSQGTKAAIGHADFYINGAHLQPGCTDSATYPVFTKISRNDLKEGQILPACSHKRSFKYFIESVERNECVFTGIKCKSYEKFTAGGCASCTNKNGTHKCAAIGLGAANVTGKFFLNTRGEFPFCQHPYSINIHISSQSPRLKGKFEMIFIDENNEVSNASVIDANQNVAEYVPGKTHTSLFYASSPKMTVIKEAKVKWIHKSNPWCVMFCHQFIIVNGISVKYISDASQDGESKLCPATKSKKIPNGEYLQFVKCDTITTEVPTETTTTSSHKTTKHHTDHHQKSTATTKKH